MIYILPLTSSTSRSFLSLSYDCTSIQNRRCCVHRMNDKLNVNHCTMCNIGSLFCTIGMRPNPTSTLQSLTLISAKNEVHRFKCEFLLSDNPNSYFRYEIGSNTAKWVCFLFFSYLQIKYRDCLPPHAAASKTRICM